mgnify:CR=1 FL=1
MITIGSLALGVLGNFLLSFVVWALILGVVALGEGDKFSTAEKDFVFKHVTYSRVWIVLFLIWLACAYRFPKTAWGLVS